MPLLKFIATVKTIVDTDSLKDGKPQLKETVIRLDLDQRLDRNMYFTKKGIENADGFKAMTNLFVAGLAASIAAAHKAGHRDESDHIRYAINELQRHFVHTGFNVTEGKWNEEDNA